MSFDAEKILPPGANIKVIGVGGGGGNAVNTMIRSGLDGVEFVAVNTDVQALRFALPETKIQIGKELTKGLGAGADPDVGRDAALEDRHELQEVLGGADMVFVTAGMGGGTGTGGASVIAQIAREMGALTVGVVTKPFNFEGKRRKRHSEMGIERLRESVDTLIIIPNQRLLQIATPDLSMVQAFRMADEVLVNAVKGISDIINIPGTVNVDFADVKTVMSSMGMALMGIGRASGEQRALEAARHAIQSPLLEDVDIEGATGILINISAGSNVSLMEVNEACSIIQDAAHEDANIIFGAVIDENMAEDIQVTVIATGFPADYEETDADPHTTTPKRVTPPRTVTSFKPVKPLVEKPAPREIVPEPSASAFEATPSLDQRGSHEAEDLTKLTFEHTPFEETASATPSVSEPAEMPISTLESAPESDVPSSAPMGFEAILETGPASLGESTLESSDESIQEQGDEQTSTEPDTIMGATADEHELSPFDTADSIFSDVDTNEEDISEEALEETPTPMENLFSANEQEASEATEESPSSFEQRIDEALELAERLKKTREAKKDEDDLEIPTFLRGTMKDLSLD